MQMNEILGIVVPIVNRGGLGNCISPWIANALGIVLLLIMVVFFLALVKAFIDDL